MQKYNVIKRIIDSNTINESDKVYFVEMFLKGWLIEEELKWIWE